MPSAVPVREASEQREMLSRPGLVCAGKNGIVVRADGVSVQLGAAGRCMANAMAACAPFTACRSHHRGRWAGLTQRLVRQQGRATDKNMKHFRALKSISTPVHASSLLALGSPVCQTLHLLAAIQAGKEGVALRRKDGVGRGLAAGGRRGWSEGAPSNI